MKRTLVSLFAMAAAVGLVALATSANVPEPSAPAQYATSVTPATLPVSCPGDLRVPVGSIESGDPDLDSTATDVTFDYFGGEVTEAGDGAVLTGDVGSQVERVGGGDIAGLAGLTCSRPLSDQWLVGGSTAIGSSARIVLTNSTSAPVEARLEFYGALGKVELEQLVAVAPQAQQSLLIEGVAPELDVMAVRVVAPGPGIAAAIQASDLDGFVPAGTDWVSSTTVSQAVTVPGIGPSSEDEPASLRMVAPEGGHVDITVVIGGQSILWPRDTGLELEAGVVTEIPLPPFDLATVHLAAETPVAAAVRVAVPREHVDGATAFDTAWISAQGSDPGVTFATVVPDGDVTLVVFSPFTGEAQFEADGELSVGFDTPGLQEVALDLAPGTVISSDANVTWMLRVTSEPGFITTLVPARTSVADIPVSVGVRNYPSP
jgi:hypothetical protein